MRLSRPVTGSMDAGGPSADLGRPRVVSAAVVLLMTLPLLGLLGAAASLIALDHSADGAARLVRELAGRGVADPRSLVDNGVTVMRAETIAQIVVKLIQALGLGTLVLFVLRRSPVARIWVFVIAGLVTIGSLGVPALFALRNARLEELARKSRTVWLTEHDLLPGWYWVLTYAGLALSVAIAGALVWLLTRPAADAYFRRDEPPPEPPPPLRRRLAARWGLIATTALAVPLIVVAATQEWMWVVHIAPPIHSERPYYAADLSVTALAFIAGAALLVLLVASGIAAYGRTAKVLALCALGVATALALDLLLVAGVIDQLRSAAAEIAIGMRRQPGVRWIGFFVNSPALDAGTPALLLLAVAAAQIPRPDLGPRIQAAFGTALVLTSLVLPWVTVYSSGLPRETSFRLWLAGGGGMLLGLGAILLVLAATPLLKPPRHPIPLAQLVATLTLAAVVMIGTVLVDTSAAIEAQLTWDPLATDEGMPPFYLDLGILLLCVSATRAWSRGRTRSSHRRDVSLALPAALLLIAPSMLLPSDGPPAAAAQSSPARPRVLAAAPGGEALPNFFDTPMGRLIFDQMERDGNLNALGANYGAGYLRITGSSPELQRRLASLFNLPEFFAKGPPVVRYMNFRKRTAQEILQQDPALYRELSEAGLKPTDILLQMVGRNQPRGGRTSEGLAVAPRHTENLMVAVPSFLDHSLEELAKGRTHEQIEQDLRKEADVDLTTDDLVRGGSVRQPCERCQPHAARIDFAVAYDSDLERSTARGEIAGQIADELLRRIRTIMSKDPDADSKELLQVYEYLAAMISLTTQQAALNRIAQKNGSEQAKTININQLDRRRLQLRQAFHELVSRNHQVDKNPNPPVQKTLRDKSGKPKLDKNGKPQTRQVHRYVPSGNLSRTREGKKAKAAADQQVMSTGGECTKNPPGSLGRPYAFAWSAAGAPAACAVPERSESGLERSLEAAAAGRNGGIDLRSLELRYLSDKPGDGRHLLEYAFIGKRASSYAGQGAGAGLDRAVRASDAFFVWLSVRPDAFWVNLSPDEPDRIIDEKLGRTDVGRVMLEADLRMKKTVGELIHPDTKRGKRFWDGMRGDCLTFRNWIVPGRAQVYAPGDELYIVDAPLKVMSEADYLKSASAGRANSCALDSAAEEHNEAMYRELVLPELERAVNEDKEYAALRRIYLSRVAAEWYRQRARQHPAAYGSLIDSGDISRWRYKGDWTPRDTFDAYVDSYKNGEFNIKHRTRKGDYVYTKTYVYGGVDWTNLRFRGMDRTSFERAQPGLAGRIGKAFNGQAIDPGGDTVWVGGSVPVKTEESRDPGIPLGVYLAGLLALMLGIVIFIVRILRTRQ